MKFGDDIMWLIVMFDLPTGTKDARKEYAIFRKQLLDNGYSMMQYSVYMRDCPTDENAKAHIARIKAALPAFGAVRIIKITDTQFGNIESFIGKRPKPIEKPVQQLMMF